MLISRRYIHTYRLLPTNQTLKQIQNTERSDTERHTNKRMSSSVTSTTTAAAAVVVSANASHATNTNNNNNNNNNSCNTTNSSTSIQYRRSTRTALYPNHHDTTSTTPVVVFPRRWPGIGTAFQCTKLPPLLVLPHQPHHSNRTATTDTTNNTTTTAPDSTPYVNTRPSPLRMSKEYPHCTMIDVRGELESFGTNGTSFSHIYIITCFHQMRICFFLSSFSYSLSFSLCSHTFLLIHKSNVIHLNPLACGMFHHRTTVCIYYMCVWMDRL